MKTLLTIAILAFTIQPVLAQTILLGCPPNGIPGPGGCSHTNMDTDTNDNPRYQDRSEAELRPQRQDDPSTEDIDESESDEDYAKVVAAFNEWQNKDLSGPEAKNDFNFAPLVGIAVVGFYTFATVRDLGLIDIDEDVMSDIKTFGHYDYQTGAYSYGIRYTIPLN